MHFATVISELILHGYQMIHLSNNFDIHILPGLTIVKRMNLCLDLLPQGGKIHKFFCYPMILVDKVLIFLNLQEREYSN